MSRRLGWLTAIGIALCTLAGRVEAATYAYTYRTHATDCTSLTDGKFTHLCYEADAQTLWQCVPSAGDCDTAGEWKQVLSILTANPSGCSAGQYVTDISQSGTLTCGQVAFSELSGAATDGQIPNTITIDLATVASTVTVVDSTDSTSFPIMVDSATGSLAVKTDGGLAYNASTGVLTATGFAGPVTGNASTATALAANGANCSASQAPLGVDASGAVESCTDFEEELTNSAGLAAALSDEVGNAGGFTRGTAGSTDECVKWDANGNLVTAGAACGTSSGAPVDATYITQTANGTLSNEQALASLSSGIMRVATTTGVVTSLTTSIGISDNLSDETGTGGALVFASSPAIVTPSVNNGATGAGSVAFKEDADNGSNAATLVGPASTADVTLTLPAETGTVCSTGSVCTGYQASLGYTAANAATTLTVAGTSNEISSSAGAQDLSANRTWTLSLPATVDLGGKTSFEVPNGADPTTDVFGELAADNNAWAASRGALEHFDGTASTFVVAALASDAPGNGQVPKWNTGGTITWEDDTQSAGSATAWDDIADPDADTTIGFAGFETDFTSSIDSNGKFVWTILNSDADTAADTGFVALDHNDGADVNVIYLQARGDVDGTPQTDYLFTQTAATIRPDLSVTGTLSTTGGLVVDATTETNIEAAIDTLANLTSASALATVGTITSGTWNAGAVTASAIITGNAHVFAANGTTSSGEVRLAEDGDNGSNYVALSSVASLASNRSVLFPDDAIADDDVLIGSTANTLQYAALPDCDDAGGNHLNYDQGTNAWSCGTSSSGGTTKWNAIADADGAGTVDFAGNDQDLTSAEDGGDVLTILTTDADQASDTTLLRLGTNDTNDANTRFLIGTTDDDGAPVNDWIVAATGTVGGLTETLGSAGVRMTTDGDGALTLLGLGDGSDEDLTINLDDTANTAVVSSSTGVTGISLTSIGLTTGAASNLSAGTVTLGVLAGAMDAGGATSFEVPNGTNPTTDADGEVAVDASTGAGAMLRFYAGAAYALPAYDSHSFCITNTTSAGDFGAIWKTPQAITIRSVNVVQTGATNVVGHLDECDSGGATCATVDSSDITADGGNDADDGSLSNASIDANDWVGWHTTSVSGTNTRTCVTFAYTVDQVN
jgi:hypothetical protein